MESLLEPASIHTVRAASNQKWLILSLDTRSLNPQSEQRGQATLRNRHRFDNLITIVGDLLSPTDAHCRSTTFESKYPTEAEYGLCNQGTPTSLQGRDLLHLEPRVSIDNESDIIEKSDPQTGKGFERLLVGRIASDSAWSLIWLIKSRLYIQSRFRGRYSSLVKLYRSCIQPEDADTSLVATIM